VPLIPSLTFDKFNDCKSLFQALFKMLSNLEASTAASLKPSVIPFPMEEFLAIL
jgi:hypothetical protein